MDEKSQLKGVKIARQSTLRCEIAADKPGSGWCGDSPEREWAAAMAHHVKEKMPKATAEGFVRYPANWLIVYDTVSYTHLTLPTSDLA